MKSATPVRIELPFMPNSSVNVHLFVEPEPVLIDAGFDSDECWAALQSALATHGLQPRDLRQVIITHPHVDHYGLAARIAAAGPATVAMATTGVHWLRHYETYMQRRIDYYRQEFLPGSDLPAAAAQRYLGWLESTMQQWQPVPSARIVEFPIDQPLSLGGADWQVIHTPGHDSTLVCFYQPETRQLLSADALMIPTATPVVDAPPPGQPRAAALIEMIASLQRLAALDVATVYPGHGAPFGDHRALIAGQIARIHERKGDALQRVTAGADTLGKLFAGLYGERAATVGVAGVWMALGYLDLLEAEGQVTKATINGVWKYHLQKA